MKITEDTPTRFTITCRRPILADVVLLALLLFGTGFIYAMLTGERTVLTAFFLVIGFVFALVGAWGLIYNARATVTLDAATRTITFHWRQFTGAETRTLPFDDLARVTVQDDDNMHTLLFWPRAGQPIFLEKAYTTNPAAFDVANRLERWLAGTAP